MEGMIGAEWGLTHRKRPSGGLYVDRLVVLFYFLPCPCPDVLRYRLPVAEALQGDTLKQQQLPSFL